jgi:hypothetical protein
MSYMADIVFYNLFNMADNQYSLHTSMALS